MSPTKPERNASIGDATRDAQADVDLSSLSQSRQALLQAVHAGQSLWQRVRLLEEFRTGLDSFFMRQVHAIKDSSGWKGGHVAHGAAGRLKAIRRAVLELLSMRQHCQEQLVRPGLTQHGIELPLWADLADAERRIAETYYASNIFPVLTPLATDPGHPFPHLSNLSVSLGIMLRAPRDMERVFVRVKIPRPLPPYVPLQHGNHRRPLRFVSLLELVRNKLERLCPHMEILSVTPFRITRGQHVAPATAHSARVDHALNAAGHGWEAHNGRHNAPRAVRLEHGPQADPHTLSFLMKKLDLTADDLYEMPEEGDYGFLHMYSQLGGTYISEQKPS